MIDGPIIRPACQGIEPSAMALGKRSRSINWGISAIRVGSSNARNVLLNAASTSRCGTRASPRNARPNATVRTRAVRIWVPISKPQPVDAIGHDAAEELEDDEGHALGQAEIAERQRVAGHLPRDPGERGVLRAVPENVEDQPDPVEAVVPRLQGGERGETRGPGRGRHGGWRLSSLRRQHGHGGTRAQRSCASGTTTALSLTGQLLAGRVAVPAPRGQWRRPKRFRLEAKSGGIRAVSVRRPPGGAWPRQAP